MNAQIIDLIFGKWNNISVEFMMALAAIWVVALIIKLAQVSRAKLAQRNKIRFAEQRPAVESLLPAELPKAA
jgi:hypothetical protein